MDYTGEHPAAGSAQQARPLPIPSGGLAPLPCKAPARSAAAQPFSFRHSTSPQAASLQIDSDQAEPSFPLRPAVTSAAEAAAAERFHAAAAAAAVALAPAAVAQPADGPAPASAGAGTMPAARWIFGTRQAVRPSSADRAAAPPASAAPSGTPASTADGTRPVFGRRGPARQQQPL